MYVPELNDIPIEENYAVKSQEDIKKAYKQYKRKTQKKKNKQVKGLHILSSFQNFEHLE